jgi:hypothetical protein
MVSANQYMWRVRFTGGLAIEKATSKEAPGSSVVKVEVPVSAEVFAGEELAIGLGHQPNELLIVQLFELISCDRSPDPKFWRFHK